MLKPKTIQEATVFTFLALAGSNNKGFSAEIPIDSKLVEEAVRGLKESGLVEIVNSSPVPVAHQSLRLTEKGQKAYQQYGEVLYGRFVQDLFAYLKRGQQ